MHVGGVEIVLLVPGGGRQHDVGVDAGRRHAEIERDQQVELSLRPVVVPDDFLRLDLAGLAQILALHAMRGAEQVLEEIFVALARGAEQVRAPHEHVARPIVGMVRVFAGHLQFARLERLRHVILRLEAGGLRLFGEVERVLPQLRRRRQPAHALGAHIEVDQRAIPRSRRRGRRDHLVDADGFVAPLIGVRVEERGGVLLTRRSRPIEREGERRPARLRPQLLLADVMRPAAARLADAAAQHQHVDDTAVVHVAVVPMVHGGADDDHRAALGLLGVEGEFARHRDDLVARHAGDLFRPGRRIGLVVVIGLGDIRAAEAAVERRNWRRTGRTPRRPAPRRPSIAGAWPAPCAPARSG